MELSYFMQTQTAQVKSRIQFQVPALERNGNGNGNGNGNEKATIASKPKSAPPSQAQAQAQAKRAEQIVLLTKYYEDLQQLVQQARNDGLFLSEAEAEAEAKSEAVSEAAAVVGAGESESESEGVEKNANAGQPQISIWERRQLKRREFLAHLQARQADFSKILTPLEEALKQLRELIYEIASSFTVGLTLDIWSKSGFKFDAAKRQEKEKEDEAKLKLKNMRSENAQYVSDALNLRWLAYQASQAPDLLKHIGTVYSVKPFPVDVSALPVEIASFINSVNAMWHTNNTTNTNPTGNMAPEPKSKVTPGNKEKEEKEARSQGRSGYGVKVEANNPNLPQLGNSTTVRLEPEPEPEQAGGNTESQPQPQPQSGANQDKEWWQYYGIDAGSDLDQADVSKTESKSDSTSSSISTTSSSIPLFGLSGKELQFSPRPTLCIGRPGAGGAYDLENCALADMRRSDTENIGKGNSGHRWNSVVLVDSSSSGERIDDILDRLPATHDKLTCLVDPTDTERVTNLSLDDMARLIDKGANIFYRLPSGAGAGAGAGKTQQQELRANILKDLLRVFRMRSYNQPAAELRRLVSVYFDEWEWLTTPPGFNFESLKITLAQICEGGGLPFIVTKDAAGAVQFLREVYPNSAPDAAPDAAPTSTSTTHATTATEDARTTKRTDYNYNLIVKALPANQTLREYYAKLLARLGVDDKECSGSGNKESWSVEAILSKFRGLPPFGGVGYFPCPCPCSSVYIQAQPQSAASSHSPATVSACTCTTSPEQQKHACNLVVLRTLYQELNPSRAETEPEAEVEEVEEPLQLIEELTRHLWHRGKLKWIINPSRNKTEFQLAGLSLDNYTSNSAAIRHLQRWLIELESVPLENGQRQRKFEGLSEADWQLYRAARYGRDQALTNYIIANPDIVANFRQRVIMLSRLQWGTPIAEARAKERR
jgi:hypothetical protein